MQSTFLQFILSSSAVGHVKVERNLHFLLPVSPPSELNFNLFASHERRTRTVKRDGHWLFLRKKINTE
jgi:hypothetical protein